MARIDLQRVLTGILAALKNMFINKNAFHYDVYRPLPTRCQYQPARGIGKTPLEDPPPMQNLHWRQPPPRGQTDASENITFPCGR